MGSAPEVDSLNKKVLALQRQKLCHVRIKTKYSNLLVHRGFNDLSLQCQNFLFKESVTGLKLKSMSVSGYSSC